MGISKEAPTVESKEQPEQRRRGRPVGYKVSEETKAKISAAQVGRILSPEHRRKLSASHIHNKKDKGGHPQTLETRVKQSRKQRKNLLTGKSMHSPLPLSESAKQLRERATHLLDGGNE